jgi:predicted PurR-regulated permease PerM
MTGLEPSTSSPSWNSSTKLVVGLTFVAVVAALLVRFQTLVGPLILVFMLTYLLYPLVSRLSEKTKLSWRMSASLIFLILVFLLITSFTLAGFVVAQQLQSLVGIVGRFVDDLPELVRTLSTQVYTLGPFTIDLSQYLAQFNLESLVQELLSIIQPVLGRAGGVVGTLATTTVTTIGYGLFVLVVSYFMLADGGRVQRRLVKFELPGYDADIRRLGVELSRIWNAFLRGQVIIFVLTVILYTVLMTILGVRYAIGIAILAGLSRFIPYVGPLAVVIVTALVTLFQDSNYFGLQPWQYMILVVAISLVVDQVFDNIVAPRFLGDALGVHPGGVLVVALILANLIGLIGLLLAAPALATLNLVGLYTIRKMFDLDPWEGIGDDQEPLEYPWTKLWHRIHSLIRSLWERWRQRRP